MKINNADSPLWNAIKRLKAAKRSKASPKMINHLEQRVRAEAAKVAAKLGPCLEETVRRIEQRAKMGVPE